MTTITVLCSLDGSKHEIDIPLSESLNTLRTKISQCSTLQTIFESKKQQDKLEPTNQRIFHLGRELKTGKRSLSGLGIGKFDVYLIHLTCKLDVTGKDGDTHKDGGEGVKGTRKKGAKVNSASASSSTVGGDGSRNRNTLELSSDDDETTDAGHRGSRHARSKRKRGEGGRRNASQPTSQPPNQTVVEIIDIDSDDDDDEVKLIETTSATAAASSRRRDKRTREC